MTKHFKDKSGPGVSKFALAFSALLLAGCSDDNSTVTRDDPPVISRTAFLGSWSCSGRTRKVVPHAGQRADQDI